MISEQPFVSVIIAVFNGGDDFRKCLEALYASVYEAWECIVVDDGSTDDSAEIARSYGATVIQSPRPQGGPAVARNHGAQIARGEILFFIDADVLVRHDTVGRVADNLANPNGPVACIGSYDDEPAAQNLLSQYKNLQHHFVHQSAHAEASTFWTGCGAIRKDVFLEMGGFDTSFERPSIEDIELGYRIKAAGYRIKLDKQLQVKHLKRWTVHNLLTTDIRDRAIPWTRLILQNEGVINDLNLQTSQRISAGAVFLGVGALILGLWIPFILLFVIAAVVVLICLNSSFYGFLANKKGTWFTVRAIPWHWLYFVYSSLAFASVLAMVRLQSLFGRSADLEGSQAHSIHQTRQISSSADTESP